MCDGVRGETGEEDGSIRPEDLMDISMNNNIVLLVSIC